jgi:hypothetical protein
VLHEVGHGAGDALGGHAYAETNAFAGWRTKLDADTWSQGLWGNDATLTARARTRAGGRRVVESRAARIFLAQQIGGNGLLPPPDWDPDEYEKAILAQYGDQKLVKYNRELVPKKDLSSSYEFSGTDNYGTDGNVYVWLTRGDSAFSSYTQRAHAAKVSWYSLAAPHEWFAEQYTHYYRLGKSGEGLDPATRTKLDEIDVMTPPAAPAPAVGAPAPSPTDNDTRHRLPFPW